MAQQPRVPGIGEDVSELMPVGADVSALMGGGITPARPVTSERAPTPVADFFSGAQRVVGQALGGNRPSGGGPLQGGVLEAVNPLPMLDVAGELLFDPLTKPEPGKMPVPKAAEMAVNVLKSHWNQLTQAWDLYKEGKPEAMQHLRAAFLPIIGPALMDAEAKLKSGELTPSSYAGYVLGTAGSMLLPENVRVTPKIKPRLIPAMQKAVPWGEAKGIGMDIGTVTGNKYVRGIQQLAQESLFGGAAQDEALAIATQLQDKAREFGTQVSPKPATPMSAGIGVAESTLAKERALGKQATERYKQFETAAEAPGLRTEVERSPEEIARLEAAASRKTRETFGDNVPTREELNHLALIRTEMDELRHQPGDLMDISDQPDSGYQGMRIDEKYVPPVAGAPVIHDINQFSLNRSEVSRPQAIRSIDAALTTGEWDETARAALNVVRERMAGKKTVSAPPMPLDYAVMPEISKTEMIQAPVDYLEVQKTLRPVLQRLERMPGWAQRQTDPAVVSLRSIVEGPRYRPVGETNQLLSALKHVERGGQTVGAVGTRNAKLGIAAREIAPLEQALSKAMTDLGMDPADVAALTEGRQLTSTKYRVQAVRKKLGATSELAEPVSIFNRLTQNEDVHAGLLARVKAISPEQMPRIGRALFDEILQPALDTGSFMSALRDFKKIGPRTREMLWGKAHANDIEQLLVLADNMTERINLSGSGMAVVKAGQLRDVVTSPLKAGPMAFVFGKLGQVLTNPKATKVLLNGLRIPVRTPATTAALTNALGRVMKDEGIE